MAGVDWVSMTMSADETRDLRDPQVHSHGWWGQFVFTAVYSLLGKQTCNTTACLVPFRPCRKLVIIHWIGIDVIQIDVNVRLILKWGTCAYIVLWGLQECRADPLI